jgi:hypothetical protein
VLLLIFTLKMEPAWIKLARAASEYHFTIPGADAVKVIGPGPQRYFAPRGTVGAEGGALTLTVIVALGLSHELAVWLTK